MKPIISVDILYVVFNVTYLYKILVEMDANQFNGAWQANELVAKGQADVISLPYLCSFARQCCSRKLHMLWIDSIPTLPHDCS